MNARPGTAAQSVASAGVLRDLADRLEAGVHGVAEPELQSQLEELVRSAVDALAALQRGTRTCEVCGAALVRKGYESPAAFASRRTCDQRCAGVMRGAARRARVEVQPVEEKVCGRCGRVFQRRRGTGPGYETPGVWAARRFCSPECGRAAGGATRRGQRSPLRAKAAPVSAVAPRPAPAPLSVPPSAPVPFPDPRRPRPEPVGAPSPIEARPDEATPMGLVFDASTCPEHGQQRGFYGCTACNAGAAWRKAERARPMKPHAEGR